MLTPGSAFLALSCVPRVSSRVLLSIVAAQSHWRELAIYHDANQTSFEPRSEREADRIAARPTSEGRNPNLGLLQMREMPVLIGGSSYLDE